ncbi:MAG: MFS transporter [Acidimicrobiia bacterium]|nr:MFS transporter [Acidimicrobiia bacterium]
MAAPPLPADVRRGVPLLVAGRLSGNTGIRFVYPFAPAIARGLGVSVEALGAALTIRELSGFAALPAGRAVDRGRRRTGLIAGLLGSALFLGLTAATSGIVWFTLAITAFGVTKITYDTAMSTWIGDHVPWERRGTIVGITELSWSCSLLVAIPLLGLAIDAWGWRAAFVAVALANLVAGLLVPRFIAADPAGGTVAPARLSLLPGALGIYAAMALLSFGIQLVIVVHGYWLEDSFGWSVATIGLGAILLGFGELVGTSGTIAFADRLGKRRTLLVGATLLVPALASLGLSGSNGAVGIALLAVVVTTYELAFVSGLPLITELDPDARGSGIGVALALVTVARAGGTMAGTALYVRIGMGWTGIIAAGVVAAVVVIVLTAVREPTGAPGQMRSTSTS